MLWLILYLPDPIVQVSIKWPNGTYSLPMVDSELSCPGTPFYWKIGYRIQDTEDILPSNDWPKDCHLKGPYTWSMVQLNFCSKTNYYEDENGNEFPAGEYCVYKKGASCPPGKAFSFTFFCLLGCFLFVLLYAPEYLIKPLSWFLCWTLH